MSRRKLKWESGTYNRTCDSSGFVFKRSELVREAGTNMLVHPKYADPEHPNDRPFRQTPERVIIE